jgi:hypothetical protein
MPAKPICVELDDDDLIGSLICVEATAHTPTLAAALRYWAEATSEDAYRPVGTIWLRETDEVVYFGGTTAWETCSRRAKGALKFWKLAPTDAQSIEGRG